MAANVFELVSYNRYRQARLVLEAGGDPNFRNEAQETPLMACVMFIREPERRTQLMRMLIGFGADVNVQNDKGQTALMYACILNQIDSVLVLLDQEQIDLNIGDVTGNTGLMYACAMERVPIVYVLLELYRTGQRSINIYQRNHSGQNAREIAEQRQFSEISALFTDAVDNDYWSSYYDMSRDIGNVNQRSYPLKIEESNAVVDLENGADDKDPSNPLASMVQHVLQVSNIAPRENEDVATDQPDFARRDSIGGSSLNTMASIDGLLETETGAGETREATEKALLTSEPVIAKSGNENNPKITAQPACSAKSSKIVRRRSLKSRQSGKSKSSTESRQDGDTEDSEIRLSSHENIGKRKGSKIRTIQNENKTEELKGDIDVPSQSDIHALQETHSSSKSNQSPTRAPHNQRINYYTRHGIDSHEANPNTKSVEIDGNVCPRPPRGQSRSRSRMRRRKTTEVCVTVSEGKIVPYYPNKQKADLHGEQHQEYLLGGDDNNNASSNETAALRESTYKYDDSPKLSVRSRKKRDNRLARPVDAGNSNDFEQVYAGYPVSTSRSYGAASSFNPGTNARVDLGNAWNGRDRQSYGCAPTPVPQYEVSYDLTTGRTESTVNGPPIYSSRDRYFNDATYGRSNSRNGPRRSGSFRAVAW